VNYDTVVGDDVAGAALVMNHLFELGHERVAHVTLDESVTAIDSGTPHALRQATYVRMMQEAGFGSFIDIATCGSSDESVYARTVRLLSAPTRPTAIFAGNDQMAIAALRAIDELGLTAADVSLAGYDDISMARHPRISLTTVNQSGELLGERAIKLLLERIAGREEAVHSIVKPTLQVRSSTRPPQLRRMSARMRRS
jgi:LacI family transcriptional regulator